MGSNIFDTRNIIKETPKLSNRFLLTPDSTQLDNIIFGRSANPDNKNITEIKEAKIRTLNNYTNNDANTQDKVFKGNGTITDVLNLSLISATIPAFEFETGDVNRFNDTVKHITKFTAPGDMTTSFYDYINGSSTSIMLAWQSKVGFKLTGEIGYKSQYVCDMNLYVYGPNRPGYRMKQGTDNYNDSPELDLLMQFKIFNAWPRSVDIGDFSYDNAEIKKVQVQFAYDMIIPYKNKGRLGTTYNTGLQTKTRGLVSSTFDPSQNSDAIYDIYVNSKGIQ